MKTNPLPTVGIHKHKDLATVASVPEYFVIELTEKKLIKPSINGMYSQNEVDKIKTKYWERLRAV